MLSALQESNGSPRQTPPETKHVQFRVMATVDWAGRHNVRRKLLALPIQPFLGMGLNGLLGDNDRWIVKGITVDMRDGSTKIALSLEQTDAYCYSRHELIQMAELIQGWESDGLE